MIMTQDSLWPKLSFFSKFKAYLMINFFTMVYHPASLSVYWTAIFLIKYMKNINPKQIMYNKLKNVDH